MKPLALVVPFLMFCFSCQFAAGQNLVPNPSFEEHTDCPIGYPDLDGTCNNWMSFRGSPDYMNNCNSQVGSYNQYGFQEPHNGEAYAGVVTYHKNIPNAREHLAIQLSSNLNIGTKYYVSFYISSSFDSISNNIASNKLGVLLTTYSYSDSESIATLPNTCQIYTDYIIADTINWIKVSGSFIADSNYKYLVIGNFFDDNHIDTLHFPNKWGEFVSYYYVDDICLSTDSLYTNDWVSVEDKNEIEFIMYPNPAFENIYIQSSEIVESICVVNEIGQIFYQKENISDVFLHIKLDLEAGTYLFKINTLRGVYYRKILIT